MTTTSNSANDCILSKPFVYFRRLSRGHSVKVSGSTSDISPLPNSNVPRPFLRPNKIKWRIKGRLRQTRDNSEEGITVRRTSQHNHPDIITILTWSVSPDKVAGHIECTSSRSVRIRIRIRILIYTGAATSPEGYY